MRLDEVRRSPKGGWKPEPGDTIEGLVVDIDVTIGVYGAYPIVDVQLADGAVVSVHAYHQVLREQLKARDAQVGEHVAITFKGRSGDGEATDAYLYAVRVGREPKRFDYAALSYTSEPTAAPPPPAPAATNRPAPSDVPAAGDGEFTHHDPAAGDPDDIPF